jgi:hypothetical protein
VRSFYPALGQRAQRLAELRRVEDRRIDPPDTARDGLRAGNDAAFEEQAGVRGTDTAAPIRVHSESFVSIVTQGTQAATCITMNTVAKGQLNADDIAGATSGMNETTSTANAILRYVSADGWLHD